MTSVLFPPADVENILKVHFLTDSCNEDPAIMTSQSHTVYELKHYDTLIEHISKLMVSVHTKKLSVYLTTTSLLLQDSWPSVKGGAVLLTGKLEDFHVGAYTPITLIDIICFYLT